MLPGWRHAPCSTDAERAALALAVTRTADREDPVPEPVWADAARHYGQRGLAALLLAIATTNVLNRVNVETARVAGAWGGTAGRREGPGPAEAPRRRIGGGLPWPDRRSATSARS